MQKRTQKQQTILVLLFSIIIVILLNVVGIFVFKRLDLTSEKRYTLSNATIELLENLKDVAYFKIYLEGDDLDADLKHLHNETKEMLDEFRAYAGDNIQYEFINPSASPNEKERIEVYKLLSKKGLIPNQISTNDKDGAKQKIVFPGAIISYQERETPVQLLKTQLGFSNQVNINNSIQGLEYEISNSIRKLTVTLKPRVAIINGHGELEEIWMRDFIVSLQEYYEVSILKINEVVGALKSKEAIIIAQPDSAFSERDKFIIDQFVMRGGKVLWMIDPLYADMDSLRNKPVMYGLPLELNLDDQLFKYGVRINSNLVMDVQAAPIPMITGNVGNQNQRTLMPWYYFPLSFPISKHPIVKNLNAVKFDFVSSIDTVQVKDVRKTILLTSGKYSRTINAPARISLEVLKQEPQEKQYNKSFEPLAVLLEGNFESLYKNRLTPTIANDSSINFKAKSVDTKMIVIADGDVCKNQVQKTTQNVYPLGYDRFSGQTFGNKNFLLNCMNYLLDNSGLISVRSREIRLRLLDKTEIEKSRSAIQMANVSIPILAILIFGIIHFIMRKRKYSGK